MADVEAVSSSVVREYLSRKGLKETLKMLDNEMPRTEKCISNRAELARELHINSLMKKNKESEKRFRSMLEVIVHFMINKTWQHLGQKESRTTNTSASESPVQRKKCLLEMRENDIKKSENDYVENERTKTDLKQRTISPDKPDFINFSENEKRKQFRRNRSSFDDNYEKPSQENLFGLVNNNINQETTNGLLKATSSLKPRRKTDKSTEKTDQGESNLILSTYPGIEKQNQPTDPHSMRTLKKGSRRISGSIMSTDLQSNRTRSLNQQPQYLVEDKEREGRRRLEQSTDTTKKQEVRKSPAPSRTTSRQTDLIFEDIDDNLEDEFDKLHFNARPRKSTTFHCQPITLKQAKDLKTIVFGSPVGTFNSEWRNQGFSFCHFDDLRYGIVQHKGGPCGLLASVQAVVLKQLLFSDRSTKQSLHFSLQETNDALSTALVEILWRAGSENKALVVLRSEKDQFIPSAGYRADRFTEKLVIYETNDRSQLEMFIKENIKQLSSDDGGCICLLYSAILTRGMERILEDMDDVNGTLMGAHGYCTQDMVNLLLTGKAISNTFDDVIELDSGGETASILKGIEKQSDIGFLSLFEHYKSCLVGSHLKNPKYPIWVVCSESHFSVLFSMKRSLVNERRPQKNFDLYYYDGLAGQNEEIRLTIDLGNEDLLATPDDPPLEHCIRTKWKNALIDWNGTEPLL